MEQQPIGNQGAIDPDVDRYPNLDTVLRRIAAHENFTDGPVERVEVTALASGEITFRYWTPRAEEPEGGYLFPPQS